MTEDLQGRLFFGDRRVPVHVVRVAARNPGELSHPHDLTEVSHGHDFSELAVILRGTGTHHVNDQTYLLQAGDVFVVQGAQRHYFEPRPGLTMVNVMYDAARLGLPTALLSAIPGYHALFILEPTYRRQHHFSSRLHVGRAALGHIEGLTDAMLRELEKEEAGYEALMLSRLIELIVYVSRQYSRSRTPEAQPLLRLGAILQRFEQNFEREYALPELAAELGLSRVHFLRLFRQATGTTPIQYLIRRRIQEAMNLLRETRMGVTEIAFFVGFQDSNYFTRQFRRATGTTPTAYRKLHGAE